MTISTLDTSKIGCHGWTNWQTYNLKTLIDRRDSRYWRSFCAISIRLAPYELMVDRMRWAMADTIAMLKAKYECGETNQVNWYEIAEALVMEVSA